MKKGFIAISCAAMLWAGCKENDAPIDFGHKSLADTTYVLPASKIPASPASHNVLVEEFTGQSCSGCPAGHTNLENIVSANAAGRINVIGLYITNFSQTKPPTGSIHDFRDSIASVIGNQVYVGISALPSGGVDRTKFSSQILLYSSDWNAAIASQLNIADSLNLTDSSTYDSATNKATITVLVTYVYQVATQQNISIAIVEDSMTD